MEWRSPFFLNSPPKSEASSENGWGDATDNSTHNDGGSFGEPKTSEGRINGWMDEPPDEEFNGWGLFGRPTTSKAISNGWMEESPKEEYNGWGSFGRPTTSEPSSNRWMAEAPKEEYNGWGIPESTPADILTPVLQTRPNELDTTVSSAPSAPPLAEEDFGEDPVHFPYPSVDFSGACVEKEAREVNEVKDGSASSSSCVICWEAPVEGACVPCGHMAVCMACLNEIKSKQGACPVCRAKIDQVIRIYAI